MWLLLTTYENLKLFSFFLFAHITCTKLQVKKETLLAPEDLQQFRNHSSQLAALDFIVSIASSVFIPTYNGNMAKIVEGHRRYKRQQILKSNIYKFIYRKGKVIFTT